MPPTVSAMSKQSTSDMETTDSFRSGAEGSVAVPPAKRHRVALACVICRQRKIKCDGRKPCKTCIDAKRPARCEYPSATPLRDEDYVRNLEEKLRQLSEQLHGDSGRPALKPTSSSSSIMPTSYMFDAFQSNPRNGGKDYIQDNTLSSGSPAAQHESIAAESRPADPTEEPVNPRSPALSSASPSEGHYLTTLASPSISSRHLETGDSSARTLLHSVEAAIQQLPHRKGLPPESRNQTTFPSSPPRVSSTDLPFAWNQSKAELYTLPQRHISDALVNVYRALNYPIFKVLHWPTFMLNYESTFTAGKQADPIWLGILNQIYAIACQIGGRDIVGDDEFGAGHKFHQRALALGYPVALCTESLQGLQYLLLMGQYLLSTSQPTLCRNVVGHAVRSAQAQGLQGKWHAARLTPLLAELRRRAWAGVIILDATASAVLGLPPLLSPDGLLHALPSGEEDDSIVADNISSLDISDTSSSLFMRETTKLLAIQIQVLCSLYSASSIATPQWPNVNSILLSARELDRWQGSLPHVLVTNGLGASPRAGSNELELQAHVLHARYLNLKLLIHRPMLFHICQRASSNDLLGDAPSHLDADIARGSIAHCCSAALLLIEHVTDSWEHGRRVGGAWWFHLYYFHSACLVLIAGLIIEVIASAKSISCIPDLARAIKTLKSAEIYLSMDPNEPKSILPRLPSGPARSTARNCYRIITGLTAHVLAAAPHMFSPAPFRGNSQREATNSESGNEMAHQLDESRTRAKEAELSDTADLYQTFLNLFPDVPTLPNYESSRTASDMGSSSLVDPSLLQNPTYMPQPQWQSRQSSTWSIVDLLRAGSAPQPLSNFDTLYPASAHHVNSHYLSGGEMPNSQNDLGFFSSYANS